MAKPHLIELKGDLGLRDAGELAAKFREAIEKHAAVAVATGNLGSADLSTVQLLVAAQKSAARAGKSFTLVAPVGEALQATLVKAGFLAADGRPRDAGEQFWTPGN
ncbi:MAG TPA: STAS domain-containing protein [Devosiaceae bacterium]|jgi:anti-anti-sigma regulatory factor|nr:STAS domain-containing protein [Devosiaceae bacterium]